MRAHACAVASTQLSVEACACVIYARRHIKAKRVASLDALRADRANGTTDTSGLLMCAGAKRDFFPHRDKQCVVFLRPHLESLLRHACESFDVYVVTAGSEYVESWRLALNSVSSDDKRLSSGDKIGDHLFKSRDAAGRARAHKGHITKRLQATTGTTSFSTFIIDDCQALRRSGDEGDLVKSVWPDDAPSVYPISAWSPLEPRTDEDDELSVFLGNPDAKPPQPGALERSRKEFFADLEKASADMQSDDGECSSWYDGSTRTYEKDRIFPPNMQDFVARVAKRRVRPASPLRKEGVPKEVLVLDTNVLYDMVKQAEQDVHASKVGVPMLSEMKELLKEKVEIHLPYEVFGIELEDHQKGRGAGIDKAVELRAKRVIAHLLKPNNRGFITKADHPLNVTIDEELREERRRSPKIESKIQALEDEKIKWRGYGQRGRQGNDLKIALAARRLAASGKTVLLVTSDKNMLANETLTETMPLNTFDFGELCRYFKNLQGDHVQMHPPSVWVERRDTLAGTNQQPLPRGWRSSYSKTRLAWYYQQEHRDGSMVLNSQVFTRPTEPAPGWA